MNKNNIKEQRRLVPVKVYRVGELWRCSPDVAGEDKVVKSYTLEGFTKFLKAIKACDNQTEPRSQRNITYIKMADDISNNIDNLIWVWSTIWNQLPKYIIMED